MEGWKCTKGVFSVIPYPPCDFRRTHGLEAAICLIVANPSQALWRLRSYKVSFAGNKNCQILRAPWYSLITVRNIDINKHFHLVSCHHQPPLHPQPPPPVSIRRIKPAEIQDSHFLQTCWINTHTHAQQPFHTSWMGCRCPDCTAGAWELLSRGFPLLWAWQQWVRCDPAPTSCMWGVCMHWAKSGCWFPGWEKPLPWWWGLLSETCLVWDFRKKADSDLWGLKLIQFRGSLKEKEYQVMHTKQDWKSVFIYYRMRKEI